MRLPILTALLVLLVACAPVRAEPGDITVGPLHLHLHYPFTIPYPIETDCLRVESGNLTFHSGRVDDAQPTTWFSYKGGAELWWTCGTGAQELPLGRPLAPAAPLLPPEVYVLPPQEMQPVTLPQPVLGIQCVRVATEDGVTLRPSNMTTDAYGSSWGSFGGTVYLAYAPENCR